MFIISVNDRLFVRPTREAAADLAITIVQERLDNRGSSIDELEEVVKLLHKWREYDSYEETYSDRVSARLNTGEPGLHIDARYLASGRMKIIIQPDYA